MKVQEIKTARQALEAAEPAERAWAEKLLRGFPAGQREWLAGCGKRAGEILLNMQDPATRVYLLIKGEVNGISAQSSGMLYRFAHFSAPFLLGSLRHFPVRRSTAARWSVPAIASFSGCPGRVTSPGCARILKPCFGVPVRSPRA